VSGLLAFGLALQGVLWTFEGYSNTTTMTEESIDPRRTLPRALVLGSVALGGTYLLVNAAYLHVLGREGLASSLLPGADLAARLFGGSGGTLFLLLAILAALGSLNGAALSAPRVAYALSRSRLAPEPLTRVNRLGTPDLATLWFAAAWSLYAWFGSFEGLVAVSIFIGALCNVAVTATLFVHRRRDRPSSGFGRKLLVEPCADPPSPVLDESLRGTNPAGIPAARRDIFLTPFYPVLPMVMLAFWSAFAAAVLYDQGWKVGYGLLAIALAAAAYVAIRAGRRVARLYVRKRDVGVRF
jgi:amino acid transporter